MCFEHRCFPVVHEVCVCVCVCVCVVQVVLWNNKVHVRFLNMPIGTGSAERFKTRHMLHMC